MAALRGRGGEQQVALLITVAAKLVAVVARRRKVDRAIYKFLSPFFNSLRYYQSYHGRDSRERDLARVFFIPASFDLTVDTRRY